LSVAAIGADTGLVAAGTRHGRVCLVSRRRAASGQRPGGGEHGRCARLVARRPGAGDRHARRDGASVGRGRQPRHRMAYSAAGVGRVCFTPNGRHVLAGQRFAHGRGWDVVSGQEVLAHQFVIAGFSRRRPAHRADEHRPGGFRRVAAGRGAGAPGRPSQPDRRDHLAARPPAGSPRSMPTARSASGTLPPAAPCSAWRAAAGLLQRQRRPGPQRRQRPARLCPRRRGKLPLTLYEVMTGRTVGSWPLPEGFDRLVCTGGQRFLSVRDGPRTRQQATQTADPHPRRRPTVRADRAAPAAPRRGPAFSS